MLPEMSFVLIGKLSFHHVEAVELPSCAFLYSSLHLSMIVSQMGSESSCFVGLLLITLYSVLLGRYVA